eukprot:436705-Pyramimonas_sp.AAC.1
MRARCGVPRRCSIVSNTWPASTSSALPKPAHAFWVFSAQGIQLHHTELPFAHPHMRNAVQYDEVESFSRETCDACAGWV